MKNQYFGDVNDYRKYGLLRLLAGQAGLSVAVCWMLTPDDGRNDGRFTEYLQQPERWRAYDPALFDTLREMVARREVARQEEQDTDLVDLAGEAEIGAVDRIFTRVGASDNLARGQSTFLVEMIETAKILNSCTSQSLVVLDEVGRGTSTHDGMSLAWAVLEYLHDLGTARPRTLFATHYHELTVLEETHARLRNFTVEVREWHDEMLFLHRIRPGRADKSYGIQVAKLAGLPSVVIERARAILAEHERMEESLGHAGPPTDAPGQLDLFALSEHQVAEALRRLALADITPQEALEHLRALRAML